MADFASNRPDQRQPRKRELIQPSVRKNGAVSKEEHPLIALRRALRDFTAGIQSLQRLSHPVPAQPSKSTTTERVLPGSHTERHVERVIERPGTQTTTREVHRERVGHERAPQSAVKTTGVPTGPGLVREAISAAAKAASKAAERTVIASTTAAPAGSAAAPQPKEYVPTRAPSRGLSVSRTRASQSPLRAPVTGADREARRHFTEEHPAGSPHNLPSAARLAQILRADSLMRQGTVQPVPAVQSWAKSIRGGQRRQIADIDPEHVQRVLHQAVGGAAAAEKLLFTPEVHRLVERHSSTLTTIKSGLKETEKSIDRVNERGGKVTERLPAKPGAASVTHAPQVSNYTGMTSPDAPASTRTETELAQMLATNEEPHLYAEASEQTRAMQEPKPFFEGLGAAMAPKPSAPPAHKPKPEAVKAMRTALAERASRQAEGPPAETHHTRREMSGGMEAAPAQRREMATSISAAPRPMVTTGMREEKGSERKRDRMELTGTMTLVNRGQPIGEAHFNGEMRG